MVDIKRGDVVYVDLDGGRGVEKTKTRPCVVVQNDGGNARAPFTIIVPVTDHDAFKGFREQVEIPASELGADGKLSVASCGELRQIDKSRIDDDRGVIATLPADRMLLIDKALKAALALS